MEKTDKRYQAYIDILREELIPAMGCTEPIAVAYAAAAARNTLGELPDKVLVEASGSMIKNVKSVIVPNTDNMKGLEAAAAAGIVAGKQEKKLEVIADVTPEQTKAIRAYLDQTDIKVRHVENGVTFDIILTVWKGEHSAQVRIAVFHTNIVHVEKDGEVLVDIPVHGDSEETLTDRTGDSFAFCQVFSILPMLLVLLAGLTIKVGQMLRVKNRFWYFLIGMTWMVTYPWLRMSAMLSQPDWFGLIFAFSILLLTLDFRFEKLEPVRFCLLFAATAAIILSRRWYLYFVVGYYFAYAVLVLVSSARTARAGQKKQALLQVRNLVLFGLMSMVAMLILLWPMVRKILGFDYAGRYSYYNFGGITLELAAQTLRIGLLNFILIGMGLWFAAKRRLPALPCLAGTELLVSLVLFTRVQNTGSHQMLLFVPGWLLLFLVGSAALADGLKKHTAVKLCYWGFTMVFAVSVRCSPLTTVALPGFVVDHFPLKAVSEFVRLDKLTYDRTDAAQIQRVDDWIDAHCDAEKGEFAYMIPHDMLYCPDHFKNCLLPEMPINDKLAFGFSVPGTHNFPMQFFEAKYVLTADPFPQTFVGKGELSHKLNERFLAVRDEYFTQEATFDMGNGTTFTIWRRTVAPTRAEVEYYLSAFKEEDAQYPEMFSQIAESWLAARGL